MKLHGRTGNGVACLTVENLGRSVRCVSCTRPITQTYRSIRSVKCLVTCTARRTALVRSFGVAATSTCAMFDNPSTRKTTSVATMG